MIFSSYISVIHVFFINYCVCWYNYIFLHFAYINIWTKKCSCRNVKRNVAVELETLAGVLGAHVTHTEKESFHEYLRSTTNIITKNVYSNVDNTYKSLSNLANNKNIVILAADKETCTVILNRTDYQNKVNNVINEGIAEGKYIETVDNTH